MSNNISRAIYLTGASMLLLIIYYLFSTDSVAFSGFQFILPIGLTLLAFRDKNQSDRE